MNIHTTDKRNENSKTIYANVIYNRSARKFNILICLRAGRHNTWNRWADQDFRTADAAIRYAEVTVANWNL